MNANRTYVYMVRCKCPGPLGAARVEVNYSLNRDGYDVFHKILSYRCYEAACWTCHRHFKFAELHGKVSQTHQCGAKCMASKGPTCECSCGGKNHGSSYA